MKQILITGAAGFIGFHLSKTILENNKNIEIIGIDNLNDYYDVNLKKSRLSILEQYSNFTFIKQDLSDKQGIDKLFEMYNFSMVVNLAAQAGVRYSIDNPQAYIDSNMVGFFNVLEACRHSKDNGKEGVQHLLYASSSSVYGMQEKVPFSTDDDVSKPISLYAATKKSNELMAYTYSHLYGIPTTGLRFFTVYGPYGRPDMAYFGFTQKILNGETIKIFNNGDMRRDFTYIDDIVTGITNMLDYPPKKGNQGAQAAVYNIGNNQPEQLLHYIEVLETSLSNAYGREIKAAKEFLPMQPGDVYQTYADVAQLMRDFNFKPSTTIEEGLDKFAKWYKDYYK